MKGQLSLRSMAFAKFKNFVIVEGVWKNETLFIPSHCYQATAAGAGKYTDWISAEVRGGEQMKNVE